jgi:hypothetical protein
LSLTQPVESGIMRVDADGADCAVAEGGGVADVGDVDAHARAEVEAVGEI